MSIAPQDDDAEREADRQADAMKAQLRKDVDSWSKARSDASPGRISESSPPADKRASVKPATRPNKSAAAPAAAKPAGTRSKPFSMSYGGETTKDYMQYMISRGVR